MSSGKFEEEFALRLERILKPFFHVYDHDHNNTLCKEELQSVFNDLGEKVTPNQINILFEAIDADHSGNIDYKEFVRGVSNYITSNLDILARQEGFKHVRRQTLTIEEGEDDGAEDGEEAEVR